MRLSLLALCCLLLCVGVVRAQTPQQQAAQFLSEMPGKIHRGEATEDDMLTCRDLHENIRDEKFKRRLLLYAAQYQRLYRNNPKRSLEILMPQLLDRDALRKWQSGGDDELPRSLLWAIRDDNVMAALEIAQSLVALEKTEFALEIVDEIGKKYTDETRAFAAACAGDIYNRLGDLAKAAECYKLGERVFRGVRSNDYYYVKSDVAHVREEVDAVRRRMSESLKAIETQAARGKNAAVRLDLSEWKERPPKVDRLDIHASFIICMIPDGDGGAFVGTEDYGVYHYNNEGKVKQYTDKDGMGDPNAYALAVDKLGRLWAGNLNTGVSVYNGETWRNYDVVDGPIGERIFDIQINPVDGDVWMATSAGITRYKIDSDEWEHFTREDGLLEDQASSLAFKNDGTLIVGTQCHGIAVFNRDCNGNYRHARNITAPERYGPGNCSPVPLVPFGNGLPTNQINQIIVARDGNIWIATPTGLVRSDSSLRTIQYVRGRNYADKVRGLYGGAPKDWKECPKEIMEQLLPEDYITCVAEDNNGTIWIGTRLKGFMAIDPKTGRRGTGDIASMGMADNYVSAILPMSDDMPLVGLYIGGVIKPQSELKLRTSGRVREGRPVYSVAQSNFAPLPSPIKPPTIEELKEMQTKLEKLNKPLPKVYAAYYGEDWKTQGDWLGRTSRDYTILCAGFAPFDSPIIHSSGYYRIEPFIGPHHREHDTVRLWVHWVRTENPRSLYEPTSGYRRQAEWDDHGETYSWSMDGPHLWYILEVNHAGVFKVDMYFFNKDGHDGFNRMRDYQIEVYPTRENWNDYSVYGWPEHGPQGPIGEGITEEEWLNKEGAKIAARKRLWVSLAQKAEATVRSQTPLCKSRVRDFWGGVHKQLLVTGPAHYLVKIDRNNSFNTIISSVGIDRILGEVTKEEAFGIPQMAGVPYDPPKFPNKYSTPTGTAVYSLWQSLDKCYDKKDNAEIQRLYRVKAWQSAHDLNVSNEGQYPRLPHCIAWRLNQWDAAQQEEWKDAMKRGHLQLLEKSIGLREALEDPDTPEYREQRKRYVDPLPK